MTPDAAIAVVDHDSIGATALPTFEEPREQIGGTARTDRRTRLRRFLDVRIPRCKRLLLALDRLPLRIADDAQIGNLIPDPRGLGIEPRDALPGSGVCHPMFVIPDAHPDIKLVVDDAGAPAHIASDTCVTPWTPRRTCNAVGVKVARNSARALTGRELAEDALNDQRLHLIDFTLAAHQLALAAEPPDDTIAISVRPRREALLDPPAKAAMRLLGEVFQKERVHRALEPDMKFADLAFGERDQRHPRKL